MKSTKSTLIFQLLLLVVIVALLASCSVSKSTLKPGWYTYSQIKRSGYDCEPFKGRHYIRATADSAMVNIVKVK